MLPTDSGGSATQTLRIEPSAIPAAQEAFQAAADAVTKKIKHLTNLPPNDWAQDPVSVETSKRFEERTTTGSFGSESALHVLTAYRNQLQGVADKLGNVRKEYERMEGGNTALWGKHGLASA